MSKFIVYFKVTYPQSYIEILFGSIKQAQHIQSFSVQIVVYIDNSILEAQQNSHSEQYKNNHSDFYGSIKNNLLKKTISAFDFQHLRFPTICSSYLLNINFRTFSLNSAEKISRSENVFRFVYSLNKIQFILQQNHIYIH